MYILTATTRGGLPIMHYKIAS